MATHSSALAWRIPWTEEPGRLQSMGSQELDMTEWLTHSSSTGFPGGPSGKEPTCLCRRCKRQGFKSLGQEDQVEKCMATHSSILAWRIPWTEEPGRLQSMGSQELDMTARLSTAQHLC